MSITEIAGRPLGMAAPEIVASWQAGTLTIEEARKASRQRREENEQEHARRAALVDSLATRRPRTEQAHAAPKTAVSLKLVGPRAVRDARDYFRSMHQASRPGAIAWKDQYAGTVKNLARRMGEEFNFDVGKAAASLGIAIDLDPSDAERRRYGENCRASYFPKSNRIMVFERGSDGVTVALAAHELAHAVMKHEPGKDGRYEGAAQEAAAETFARSFLGLDY